MKKNFFKIICISIICLLTLSSCSLLEIIGDIIDDAMGGGSNDPINQLTSEDYQYDENLNDVDLVIEEDKAGHNTSIKDFREKTGIKVFPSTGEQKLLVIPVYFSDFPLNKCSITDPEEARKNIYKAFFGSSVKSNDENMTGWESVSSFYEKSSYGKLKITGEVAPWYAVNSTLMQAAQNGQKGDPSIKILRDAVDNYKKTNFAEISNYDSDKDGYIDGVVIVYANPYYSNNAFTNNLGRFIKS